MASPTPSPILTTSMRQIVVSTSLGWETMTSEVANTFTSASSFCNVTEGGFGTWILMVSGKDSGYCWNTWGWTPGQSQWSPGELWFQWAINQPLNIWPRVSDWASSNPTALLKPYKPHAGALTCCWVWGGGCSFCAFCIGSMGELKSGGVDSKSLSSMPNAWKCSEPAVEQAEFTRTFTIESSHRNNSMGYFFLHVID